MDSSQQALQTTVMEIFFKFIFGIIGEQPKNIQTNSEAWILVKVQYVIYQWIRLDKLYKLMESFFFQISKLFFESTTIF